MMRRDGNQPGQPRRRPPDYITEQVRRLDWRELADRQAPLPSHLSVDQLLEGFKQLYIAQISDRFPV